VELVYACDESLRLLDTIVLPDKPGVEVTPVAGVGHGCTEAPRGFLYHRYEIDDEGRILSAQIVPPTSQNQASIEADLGAFVEQHIDVPHDDLQWQCEQAIRNYDPCISCSAHFLKLDVVG
jgi:coenzyme F420-reducing hydrogenase alpha subunit